jgi:MoxR-like ATPase
VRLCLACLLARGHLLIEDVPGVGKTTLAQTLARVLGLEWSRLQFTSDMLPADIVGVSIFDRNTQKFQFRRGPVFTQLLLADEINRASPKAQSALLEAMEERQVSVDGITTRCPNRSSWSRLRIRTSRSVPTAARVAARSLPDARQLGLSGPAAERRVLLQGERRELLHDTPSVLGPAEVLMLQRSGTQRACLGLHCSTTCRRWSRARARNCPSGCPHARPRACCAPPRPGP